MMLTSDRMKRTLIICLAICGLLSLGTSNAHADKVNGAHEKPLERANREGIFLVEPGIHNLGYTRDGNMLIAIDDRAEVDALYPGCRRMAVGADAHRQFCKKPVRSLTPGTAPAGPVLGEDQPDYVPTPFDAAYSVAFSVKPQPARLNIQPSKGWALKDIPTIFYVSNTEQMQSVSSFLGEARLRWRVLRHVFEGAAVTEDSQKLEIWERKVQLIEPGSNH